MLLVGGVHVIVNVPVDEGVACSRYSKGAPEGHPFAGRVRLFEQIRNWPAPRVKAPACLLVVCVNAEIWKPYTRAAESVIFSVSVCSTPGA